MVRHAFHLISMTFR